MVESISYHDGASEGFYHGMMLGLCAVVSNRYRVRSNGESGDGRFDIQLYPENNNIPGFIFEFKKAQNESEMEELADKALKQIEDNRYDTQMKADGITNIVKVGIAFFGKQAKVKSL